MPDHQLIGPFGSDHPTALAADGRRIGDAPDPAEVVLYVFPAPSWDSAVAIYRDCKQRGIAAVLGGKAGPGKVGEWWRFPGATGPLIESAVRLGISTGAIHRCEADATLKNTATRIGECYGRYTKVKGPTKDNRDFTPEEIRHVNVLLDRCLVDDARLHAMADACRAMIEECRVAHGMAPGEYRYRVVGPKEADTAPLRAEIERLKLERDDLAGALESSRGQIEAITADRRALFESAESELAAGRDERDRLKADNAELLEQNKQLAAMVESLTAPPAEPDPVPSEPDPAPEVAPPSPPKPQPAPPRPHPHKGR